MFRQGFFHYFACPHLFDPQGGCTYIKALLTVYFMAISQPKFEVVVTSICLKTGSTICSWVSLGEVWPFKESDPPYWCTLTYRCSKLRAEGQEKKVNRLVNFELARKICILPVIRMPRVRLLLRIPLLELKAFFDVQFNHYCSTSSYVPMEAKLALTHPSPDNFDPESWFQNLIEHFSNQTKCWRGMYTTNFFLQTLPVKKNLKRIYVTINDDDTCERLHPFYPKLKTNRAYHLCASVARLHLLGPCIVCKQISYLYYQN